MVQVKDAAGKKWRGRIKSVQTERAEIDAGNGECVPGPAEATIVITIEDAELIAR